MLIFDIFEHWLLYYYNFMSKIVNTVTVNDVTMNTVTLLACLVTASIKNVISFASLICINKFGENVV